MKKFTFNLVGRFLLLLSLSALLFTSCSKDDDDADYVGTWTSTQSEVDGTTTYYYKTSLVLSESSFDVTMQYKTTGEYVTYITEKGDISVSGSKMTTKITEFGISSYNEDGTPTGTITTYKEGTDDFSTLFTTYGIDQTNTATYVVSGSTLTFTDSDGEVEIYTKE